MKKSYLIIIGIVAVLAVGLSIYFVKPNQEELDKREIAILAEELKSIENDSNDPVEIYENVLKKNLAVYKEFAEEIKKFKTIEEYNQVNRLFENKVKEIGISVQRVSEKYSKELNSSKIPVKILTLYKDLETAQKEITEIMKTANERLIIIAKKDMLETEDEHIKSNSDKNTGEKTGDHHIHGEQCDHVHQS